jgi:hypothetical protein
MVYRCRILPKLGLLPTMEGSTISSSLTVEDIMKSLNLCVTASICISKQVNCWQYHTRLIADHRVIHPENGFHLQFLQSSVGDCKGTYACVQPHRYTYGNYRNTVANVDASDSRCRCICKIIARDLRLVASRQYRMAVTRPGSRAAVTVSPSLGADLLSCKSQYNRRE